MRILCLLYDLPYPPTDGRRWKIYNLLEYLAHRHECHVLTFGNTDSCSDAEAWRRRLPQVQVCGIVPPPLGARLHMRRAWNLVTAEPMLLAYRCSEAFREAIAAAMQSCDYDVAFFDTLHMAQYWPCVPGVPRVLSTNDAMSLRYSRMANHARTSLGRTLLSIAARRVASYEQRVFERFDAVHVVSRVDLAYLDDRYRRNNVRMIPIAVAPEYFRIPASDRASEPVLFSNGWMVEPAIAGPLCDFVRIHFPQIRAACPRVRYRIVARCPSAQQIATISGQAGVDFAPWVEDYPAELARATVAVFLDATGTGIKNRVLQAMAAGKPVVGTLAAFEGLGIADGVHAMVCHSLSQAAGRTAELLASPALREGIGEAARRFAGAYTQRAVGQQWEDLLFSVVGRPVAA